MRTCEDFLHLVGDDVGVNERGTSPGQEGGGIHEYKIFKMRCSCGGEMDNCNWEHSGQIKSGRKVEEIITGWMHSAQNFLLFKAGKGSSGA